MEENKYSCSFNISSQPRFITSGMNRWLSVVLVLVSALAVFPHESLSQDEPLSKPQFCEVTGDIPFTVEMWDETTTSVCIACSGPWGRITGYTVFSYTEVDPDQRPVIPCTFYAAKKTVFSPYGKWDCILNEWPVGHQQCGAKVISKATFCVEYAPPNADNRVRIFLDDNQVHVPSSPRPCKSSAVSFLGDHTGQKSSIRDKDEYLFNSVAGEEIILRLETEPQEGNNGGEAVLGIEGGSFKELTSGNLPLELSAVLPEDGQYSVIVTQPGTPDDQSFRGSYVLTVSPLNESIDVIEPATNVEK